MLQSATVRIVDFCARHAWLVVIAGMLLALAATAYDVTRFKITTDVESLISRDVPCIGVSSRSSMRFLNTALWRS